MSELARSCRVAVIALLALNVLLLVAGPATELFSRIPRNYNEGWNAFHAQRALAGEALYPPASALFTNNYPPLSFYLVGAFGLVVGDNIVAGRIVALLAFLFVTVTLGVVTRRLCGRRLPGLVAALLFAGYLGGLHPEYIAMNDPQWLGMAIQMVALLFLTTASDRQPRLGSALLAMAVAGLVKHNLVALPIATTIWLFGDERPRLRRWLATWVLVLAAGAGLLYAIFGPDLFREILLNPRQYSSRDAAVSAAKWALPLLPLLLALGAFLRLGPRSRSEQLLLSYLCTSSVLGVLFLGGAGTNKNVLYDPLIGLCVVGGLVVHRIGVRLQSRLPRAGLDAAVTALLALGLLSLAPARLRAERDSLANLTNREEQFDADIRLLEAANGPVACESLALCYWAGKPFELDFFAIGQKLRSGRLSTARFAEHLEERSYELIQVDGRGRSKRLTSGAHDLLARRFERRPRLSGVTFLVPRRR